ncbi:DUF1972 domain-containing protein [Pantoea sp. FN0307]|uniref:DUF1972 domain-containing protein n=1 Tax=Pantoea sp. FN0307 TaxID=3418560 RepID=UPI003CEA7D11
MKHVAVVGTVGLPACYGGFESLIENLTNYNDAESGIKYTVYCSSKSYHQKKAYHNGADLVYMPFKANGISSIFYDVFSLLHCIKIKADTILILGVSGCIALPIIRKITSAKIVTNIDGLEWRRDKWNYVAKRFLNFSEKMAVKYSDIIISDNQAIADYVKSEYNVNSETIAYGGDHAVSVISNEQESLLMKKENYALALCRIEPENNVETILKAFSQTAMPLKFIGNWSSSHYGMYLKKVYSAFKNIEIIEPIYDLSILKSIRQGCSVYIHGHSAGGTNPSLVEMMHFGKPIFCYDCSYNRATTEDKAVYFHDAEVLLNLINDFDFNNTSGLLMREIAQRRYVWRIINEQYRALF